MPARTRHRFMKTLISNPTMTTSISTRPANFTRQSTSFVAKFAREGRYHFIPLYWLLRLSDFAREGMEHSGSYRFADHMYRGIPSGRGWLGRLLDAALLKLPATRSMRQRCFASRDAMRDTFETYVGLGNTEPFHILTVPCGLPRDVRDFSLQPGTTNPSAQTQIQYTGIDLDPEVIEAARGFLAGSAVQQSDFRIGNALNPADYPEARPHFIASTGLGEFLDDGDLVTFYQNVFDALAPGGTFFTSAASRGRGSDTLLRAFEFDVRYRTSAEVERILALQPWKSVKLTRDTVGLQTFVRAQKP